MITPVKRGLKFDPPLIILKNLSKNIDEQNFAPLLSRRQNCSNLIGSKTKKPRLRRGFFWLGHVDSNHD
jgi:hypothetical protein